MKIRQVLAAVSATGLLVGAAACGGGDDESSEADVAAITSAARAVVIAEDPSVCSTHLSAEFVTSFFGDDETCRENAAYDEGEERPTGAAVTEISVDGDAASATVTEEGGDSAGATGQWRFTRDGEGWRVSEWSPGFLRSQLSAAFGSEYEPDEEGDPFADPATRECLVEKLLDRDDEAFLTLVKEVFRETEGSEQVFLDTFLDCGEEEIAPGVTRLRDSFEQELRNQPGVPATLIECVITELRERISDAELREVFQENEEQAAALQQESTEAATQCAPGASS